MIEAEIARSTRNTIGDALRRYAERFRIKTALAFAGRSWTYAELDLAADRVARRLLALGLEPGGRVCAFGRNSDSYLLLWPGYWDMPEETARAFEGGWFHSGDIATIDAEGYLTIVDRAKDLINTGGTFVASREVEEVLFTHPAVAEAAMIATPDPKWIEAVTAVVALRKGAGGRAARAGRARADRLCPRAACTVQGSQAGLHRGEPAKEHGGQDPETRTAGPLRWNERGGIRAGLTRGR